MASNEGEKHYKDTCWAFTNYHSRLMDCPNIQYESCDEKWGCGIADDCGMKRIKCNDCHWNTFECKDCYFEGSSECPEHPEYKENQNV
jgi:hypothetical protein